MFETEGTGGEIVLTLRDEESTPMVVDFLERQTGEDIRRIDRHRISLEFGPYEVKSLLV